VMLRIFCSFHLSIFRLEFNLKVQRNVGKHPGSLVTQIALPQSGSVSKPRVGAAATLGNELNNNFNRKAVASNWRNPFRVEKDVHLLTQG